MELKFKEFIKFNEVLDHIPNIKDVAPTWEPMLDPKGLHDYKARFIIDGDEYVVGFSKVETVGVKDFYIAWDLNRANVSWLTVIKSFFTGEGGEYNRTNLVKEKGLGYTLNVLKSVIAIIGQFINIMHPAILSYDEHDEKLKKFYSHIAIKIASKAGYKPVGQQGGILVRTDKMRDAAVMKAVAKHIQGHF